MCGRVFIITFSHIEILLTFLLSNFPTSYVIFLENIGHFIIINESMIWYIVIDIVICNSLNF